MSRHLARRATALVCGLAAALAAGPAAAQSSSCTADASWVNDPQMQATIGGGEAFCAFHQFAWQNFLALLENNYFLTFVPSQQVFLASGTPAGWTGKPYPLALGDVDKEAGDEEPLVAQNKTTVQFDIRMNRTYFDYIVANKLYASSGFNQLCSNINAPVEKTDPNDPLGSIELKSSWLQTPCDPKANLYVCSADGKYALVGMHLVQKISDHQEWIWASLEHEANAPDCDDLNQKPPSPFTQWSFFNGQHQPCGGSGQPACSANLCTPTCNKFIDATTPANVCRLTSIATDGTATTGGGPLVVDLNQSVQSLITNPALLALKNYVLVGTLWFKPGLTAPPPLGSDNPPTGQQFIGSIELANTTMETYLQALNCYSCHITAVFDYNYNAPGTSFNDAQSSEADFSHIYRIMQGTNPSNPCGSSAAATAAGERFPLQPAHASGTAAARPRSPRPRP